MKKVVGLLTLPMKKCSLQHSTIDLGKLGDGVEPYYIPQTSEWHQKNKKEFFVHNPKLQYFDVTDRAFYLLNKYGISYTQKEQLGIMMADGLYNEATKNIGYLTMKISNLKQIYHTLSIGRLYEYSTRKFRI